MEPKDQDTQTPETAAPGSPDDDLNALAEKHGNDLNAESREAEQKQLQAKQESVLEYAGLVKTATKTSMVTFAPNWDANLTDEDYDMFSGAAGGVLDYFFPDNALKNNPVAQFAVITVILGSKLAMIPRHLPEEGLKAEADA